VKRGGWGRIIDARTDDEVTESDCQLHTRRHVTTVQFVCFVMKFLPMIPYANETWVIKESMKRKILITERKIKDGVGTWRIKRSDELNNLISNKNIINYIKARLLSWFGHVHRMANERVVKKLYEWELIHTRLAGRPKIRWENDIKEDLRITRYENK